MGRLTPAPWLESIFYAGLCGLLLIPGWHAAQASDPAQRAPARSSHYNPLLDDTVPPSTPANVAASQVSSTAATLSWTASTDNVGIAGYEVLRDRILVGTALSLSFTNTGLTPGAQYVYTVRAFDGAGNRSRSSAPVLVRTPRFDPPDREAPSTPTGLSSPDQTQSSITLKWNASTDNVGVVGYEVLKSGVVLAAPIEPAYIVSGLSADSSYTFTVRALDAAGNRSSESAALTQKTKAKPEDPPPTGGGRLAGYFTSWGIYGRNYHAKNILSSDSARKLTHIHYAFANVVNGQCALGDPYADYDRYYSASESVDGKADSWDTGALRGSFNQLRKLKNMYPNLRILISVGGWSWSSGFTQAAASSSSRQLFASSCIGLFLQDSRWSGLFDGIDIDWEYPGTCGLSCSPPSDAQNFTLLLAELRRQLELVNPAFELTIAAPAGPEHYGVLELSAIHPYLDAINLMSYDFHGSWELSTNHHSALYPSPADPSVALGYSTDEAIGDYLAAGIPPSLLVVGAPFYGRGWTGVASTNNGLYQTATGAASGTWEAGVEDYEVLKGLEATYGTFWDATAEASWIYSPSTRTFWSYDNVRSMENKARYAQSLGGVMFWELSGDDSAGTLVDTLWRNQ